jgi:diguanylate cyclase (GGDEF)-like protein
MLKIGVVDCCMIEKRSTMKKESNFAINLRPIRTLKIGYVFALSFIAVLAIVNWFMVQAIIQNQSYSAAQVNTSGRQRMSSQEIAFLGLQLVESTDPSERDDLRMRLLQSVEQMKVNHKGLVEGNPSMNLPSPPIPPVIFALYFEEPAHLEEQIFKYISAAENLAETPDNRLTKDSPYLQYILNQRDQMKNALNHMVDEYQNESEQKVAKLQLLEKKVLGITLLVILVEAFFIFRPLVNTVQKEQRFLKDSNVELHHLSSIDGLTGIANRRAFDQFAEKGWQQSRMSGKPMAVIICDIDHFKAYNDTYGHLQGDECLRRIAQKMAEVIKRKEDLVARYGGEEFVIVLPNTDLEGARAVAEDLRLAVTSLQLRHESSLTASYVTISIGVAANQDQDGYSSVLELIQASDQALYQAKTSGRNQVCVSS